MKRQERRGGRSWCWSCCNTKKKKRKEKKKDSDRGDIERWCPFLSACRLFFFVLFFYIILSVTVRPDQGVLCAIESFRLFPTALPVFFIHLSAVIQVSKCNFFLRASIAKILVWGIPIDWHRFPKLICENGKAAGGSIRAIETIDSIKGLEEMKNREILWAEKGGRTCGEEEDTTHRCLLVLWIKMISNTSFLLSRSRKKALTPSRVLHLARGFPPDRFISPPILFLFFFFSRLPRKNIREEEEETCFFFSPLLASGRKTFIARITGSRPNRIASSWWKKNLWPFSLPGY